ncbi:hypothetical protein OHB41_03070 [Streptomyces sp. NBC_01571]|nr:hypothetical protein [Streptomyces sp. NBC_01571]MCX4572182.1 hypothetical protein [Streptomyces sp. NBC_01571]
MTSSATGIGTYGVERIPGEDRTARSIDLLRLAFGAPTRAVRLPAVRP